MAIEVSVEEALHDKLEYPVLMQGKTFGYVVLAYSANEGVYLSSDVGTRSDNFCFEDATTWKVFKGKLTLKQ